MIAKIVAKVDNLIYKSFKIVTPLRRAFWRQSSIKIQKELAYQHSIRDFINRHGYNVTTEEALRIYEEL
jgi:hypothetical protein